MRASLRTRVARRRSRRCFEEAVDDLDHRVAGREQPQATAAARTRRAAARGCAARAPPTRGTTCVQRRPAASHGPPSFQVTSACHVTRPAGLDAQRARAARSAARTSPSTSTPRAAQRERAPARPCPPRRWATSWRAACPPRRLTHTRRRDRHLRPEHEADEAALRRVDLPAPGTSREKRSRSRSSWPTWRKLGADDPQRRRRGRVAGAGVGRLRAPAPEPRARRRASRGAPSAEVTAATCSLLPPTGARA